MVGKNLPRSIRNNNPFNIKCGVNSWIGAKSKSFNTDFHQTFEQFDNMIFGIRAGQKLLLNYISRYGLDTIKSILERFAPSNENYTNRYIEFVSARCGFSADDKINTLNRFLRLCESICKYESGCNQNQMVNFGLDMEGQLRVWNQFFAQNTNIKKFTK